VTNAQWDVHVITLERYRSQGRLYRGFVIPSSIPKDWPDEEYSGVASLTDDQSGRPEPIGLKRVPTRTHSSPPTRELHEEPDADY